MNIGVLLTGISYGDKNRNWRKSLDNIREMVIKPYKEDHRVSVYLTTYQGRTNRLLLKDYKPAKHTLLSHFGSCQQLTYRESLCLLAGEKLDCVIATRFDIKFNQRIIDMDIDYGKFNVLFRERDWWQQPYEYTCDNLYIFPMKWLGVFVASVSELYRNPVELPGRAGCQDMHGVYRTIKNKLGDESMNFIEQSLHSSFDNPFYTLIRDNAK